MAKKDYDKIFDEVINEIAEGGKSLRDALKQKMSPSKFYDLLEEDKEKEKRYARACEERTELIADEIMEIADNRGNDIVTLKDGREVVDNAVVQRDRLRIDARKWLLAHLNPKKWGDRIDVEHSGNVVLNFPEQFKNA